MFEKVLRRLAGRRALARTTDSTGGWDAAGRSHAECQTMLAIRSRDTLELEALYRHCLFPDLPPSDARGEALVRLLGTSVGEAMHISDALHAVRDVPGDVCELGVAQGATSRLIAGEIMSSPRRLWLFDSFEGLPAATDKDRLIDDIFQLGTLEAYQGTMRSDESEVREKLAAIAFPEDRLRIRRGWVEQTLREGELPERVAFAYVDMDFYEPIRVALEFLAARMEPGARVIVDDYGFFSEGAQAAVDEFCARRDDFSLTLPPPMAGHFALLTRTGPGGAART